MRVTRTLPCLANFRAQARPAKPPPTITTCASEPLRLTADLLVNWLTRSSFKAIILVATGTVGGKTEALKFDRESSRQVTQDRPGNVAQVSLRAGAKGAPFCANIPLSMGR